MSHHAVHWHEGMFLTPQHFQAAERRQDYLRQRSSQWDCHHNWGLRRIEIDADALANHRLVIRRLQARMHDGALLSFPEDGAPPVVDLQAALRDRREVRVYLALPLAQEHRSNTAESNEEVAARYLVETRELVDENTGADGLAVQMLHPNARLLVTGDDLAGYDALPIAQIRRAETTGGSPTLDPEFIPPVLACDAWDPLRVGVLTRLLERVEKKAAVLSDQVVARRLTHDSQGAGERLLLEQLRVMNEAASVLAVDTASSGVAPLTAYRELARLVGKLSALSADCRVRPLPVYDHDDLGNCFLTVRNAVEGLLDGVVEPGYQERPFTASGPTLRVELDPNWLEPGVGLYVGVQTSLGADELERLLASGRNIKFGAGGRAEELYLLGQAGLEPRRLARAPRPLPIRRGLHYYTLSSDGAPEEQRNAERSLSLAARLSERLVVDQLGEQNALVIDADGRSATLGLSLFVVRDDENTPLDASHEQDEALAHSH
ncbi:hypothetical protein Mal64_04520 [Pseudobythopirellula maris]|uniref:Type VI secretion protein n=1 Tax=Pseudobythopirellula maris TaxID=2527991 RepID=A0A5C5ZRD6_9BACT|nr:type VI secretion system baseplate subunit TssK [Pseudobythopirellula maris]TWT90069.1 hypothetical protein Mal64_04520 [Pseudobythopirellula maris]